MNFSIKGIGRAAWFCAALSASLSLLALAACGGGGGGNAGIGAAMASTLGGINLVNGQAASAVIGQPDFTSSATGTTGTSFYAPSGNVAVDPASGQLYVSDVNNNRVEVFGGIPSVNGASASFALGQNDLVSRVAGVGASLMSGPIYPAISGGKLFFADFRNNRVGIYNTLPSGSPGAIDAVVGQTGKTTNVSGCTASNLKYPKAVAAANGKMMVADAANNRVLIWNAVPTTDGAPADLVLGQNGMTACYANASPVAAPPTASTLSNPTAVWTDGTRLAVSDTNNNRVLIWNTFPTANGQAADLVLGQPDFISAASALSATGLNHPYYGVFVDAADQLFVADSINRRVLVWNSFPTANGQAADVVLGQPDFNTAIPGVSATTMGVPTGVFVSGSQLLVTDQGNNRVLVY